MFYFEETGIRYPTRGILNDAISRNTIDEDSYSPIIDQVWNVLQQYRFEDAFGEFDVAGFPITATYKEFALNKLEEKYKRSVSSDNDEPTRAEMVSLDHDDVIKSIVQYASEIIYGWFWINKKGALSYKSVTKLESYVEFTDNADSGYMISASDLVEDGSEHELDEKDKSKYVSRLTYYMKLLQECSIAKGTSVLQVIILEAKYGQNASLLVKDGIAKIGMDGNVIDVYGQNHNTSRQWADFWKWYTNPERDMWARVVDEFKHICEKLGVDLTKEDYRKFPPRVVNKLLCVYLASNEEYVDTIGQCDPAVFELLEPSALLTLRSNLPGFKQDWMYVDNDFKFLQAYIAKLEQVQLRVDLESYRWVKENNDIEEDAFLQNDTHIVNTFFTVLINILGLKMTTAELMADYYYNDFNILCLKSNGEENPVTVTGTTLRSRFGFRNSPDRICFTASGLALSKVDGQPGSFRYCRISDILKTITSGVNGLYPNGVVEGV